MFHEYFLQYHDRQLSSVAIVDKAIYRIEEKATQYHMSDHVHDRHPAARRRSNMRVLCESWFSAFQYPTR